MISAFALLRPSSVEEAAAQLMHYDGDARLVAGSTAVTIMLRQRLIEPAALITLSGIGSLRGIRRNGHLVRLGALVTHREAELSAVLRSSIPVLADVFGSVANVRVRNAATVGGVLAEADYASDPPTAFVGLGAEIDVFGSSGARTINAADFFVAFYETALKPVEILTEVRVPVPPVGSKATYKKYVSRSAEDRPCVGVFASATPAQDGSVERLRVVVGAAVERPQSIREVEAVAEGTFLDDATIATVADGYADTLDPLDDMRGSMWYRTEMIRVWVHRAIEDVARQLSLRPEDARDE